MKNTIKVERAKKNWTQADLAEKIGISRQAMNSIETGKYVFGTPVEEIFKLEETDFE
jgi:putative transcriptional regulator